MKRIMIAAAALLTLAACAKEMTNVETPSDGAVQTITVNVEQFGDQTKTAVSPTGTFTWSAGDQIGIYPVATELGAGQTSQQIVFKINGTESTSSATFTGTGWGLITSGDYKYFSYYPYSATAAYNSAPVSFPASFTQTANANTDHLTGTDCLYAPQIQPESVSSTSFNFKHLGALVEFEVTVPDDAKTKAFTRMTVTAPSALFTTAGTYDPSSATTSAAPAITGSATTDKLSISLNGSTGFTPDADGKLHVYVLVAPAAVSGQELSIKLWDDENKVYIASRTPSSNIVSQEYKRYSCTASIKPTTTAVDLSTDGTNVKTANCYIVPEWGKYKFLANIKGNGVVPTGMTESSALDVSGCTAEVIWETVNTNAAPEVGTIVHDATIEGNYIVFEATGAQGNALIALKKGDDIIWSWHIWSTGADLEYNIQTYGGTNMMDRNLGALTAEAGHGLTLGFHYQWGRPCPITGGSSTSAGAFSSTRMATTNSSVWVEEETDATKGTLAYSAANPTHFIYASASNYYKGLTSGSVSGNWLWTADATTGYTASTMPAFWGAAKTMYDPCPIGWKVPAGGSTGVWATAGFSTDTFIWNASEKGRTFTSANAYYPAAGYRGASYTAQGGTLNSFGGSGICWSSSVLGALGYNLHFDGSGVTPSRSFVRAFGFSVRPCQE